MLGWSGQAMKGRSSHESLLILELCVEERGGGDSEEILLPPNPPLFVASSNDPVLKGLAKSEGYEFQEVLVSIFKAECKRLSIFGDVQATESTNGSEPVDTGAVFAAVAA